jgi:hypothetical protein
VENSGDWDATYHFYYNGHSMVETRDGSDDVIKQHVWGMRYIDELIQIAINKDPGADDDCMEEGDERYYAMQDANYNVLGITDEDGDLVERYEYTPYGQRTIFKSAGADDPNCSAPILESQRVQISGEDAPYGICNAGHQGLFHQKETGDKLNNRARPLDPILARFDQPDFWEEYADGMSRYGNRRNNPLKYADYNGAQPVTPGPNGEPIFLPMPKPQGGRESGPSQPSQPPQPQSPQKPKKQVIWEATSVIKALLDNYASFFEKRPWYDKMRTCCYYKRVWDIDQFSPKGALQNEKIMIDDKIYIGSEVNYVFWGFINGLCEKHGYGGLISTNQADMVNFMYIWKATAYGHSPQEATKSWAYAGFRYGKDGTWQSNTPPKGGRDIRKEEEIKPLQVLSWALAIPVWFDSVSVTKKEAMDPYPLPASLPPRATPPKPFPPGTFPADK